MNRPPQTDAGRRASDDQPKAAQDHSDLASILYYPALGRIFDEPGTNALAEMRARLERTNQELERVIRQGSKTEADRASRASRAVTQTLGLLDSLEQLRQQGGKK